MIEKKSRIVLSFDDGRADNYRIVKEILEPMSIPATFNIATAYVDGTIAKDNRPCPNDAISINMLKTMSTNCLFEIAGHGDQHLNETEDIMAGIKKIHEWLNLDEEKVIGFASPNSEMTGRDIEKNAAFYEEHNITYIRLGLLDGKSYFGRLARKISTYIRSARFYIAGFGSSIQSYRNRFIHYSVPIVNEAELGQVVALVNEAKNNKNDCILMFHSIIRPGEEYYNDTWSWDYDKFSELCKYLIKHRDLGELDIVKEIDLVKMNKSDDIQQRLD